MGALNISRSNLKIKIKKCKLRVRTAYEQRANYERELTRELLRDAPLWSAPSTRKRKTEEPRNEGAGLAHGYGVPSQKVRLGFGAIENAISEENV